MSFFEFLKIKNRTVLVVSAPEKERSLSGFAAKCIFAGTAEEAVHIVRNQRIDVAVGPWSCDGISEGDLLIKMRLANPSLPLIALIDHNEVGCEIAARSAGMTAVLSINTPDNVLRQTINHLMHKD